MSYTTTFDASHKVSGGTSHMAQFVRHIARDVDERDGVRLAHANPNIDPSRTMLNETWVNDGNGDYRRLTGGEGGGSSELTAYLDRRLATVAKPLRKDAVLLRPLILQLDPKWFDEHNPAWREDGLSEEAWSLQMDMLSWAESEFGQQNIVGYSLHLDEHSPQLQVIMTPVTDDGRLSQKDFFRGPGQLREQHQRLRTHMRARDYDADLAVSARSTERLSSAEFSRQADRMREADNEIARRMIEVERRERESFDLWAETNQTRREIDEERNELDEERNDFEEERNALEKGWLDLQAESIALSRERASTSGVSMKYLYG